MDKLNTLNQGSYFSQNAWAIYQPKYHSLVADSQRTKIFKKSQILSKDYNLLKTYDALLKTLKQLYHLPLTLLKLGLSWTASKQNRKNQKQWLITSFLESQTKYLITIFQEQKHFLHWISFSLALTWNKKIKFTYQEQLLSEKTYEKHSPQANLQNHLTKTVINKRLGYLITLLRSNYGQTED